MTTASILLGSRSFTFQPGLGLESKKVPFYTVRGHEPWRWNS